MTPFGTSTFIAVFVSLFTLSTGGQSRGQIYYSDDENEDNLDCVLGHDLYPIVNLPDSCLLETRAFCDIRDFHRGIKERLCDIHSHCPNGTLAQCVQNVEPHPYYQAIIICKPTNLQCDAFSRFVVYVDRSIPNMYRLCKKRCVDGYIKSGSAFNLCFKNEKITVFKESTSTSPAVVYCNYFHRFCNPNKPKLFEYSDPDDGCESHNEIQCSPGHVLLSDCSCDKKCKQGDVRKPDNDFKCEPESALSSDEDEFKPQVIVTSFHNKLQVSWKIAEYLVVDYIKVEYKQVNATQMKTLPLKNVYDNSTFDIERLVPGQLYFIRVTFFYIANNMSAIEYLDKFATKPLPIVDLSLELNGRNVTLDWGAPRNDSVYDQFMVKYRTVARNPKKSCMHRNTTHTNMNFDHLFPGEEYEFRICAVSNNLFSEESTDSIIIPPIPPADITIVRTSFISYIYTVSWLKYDDISHVDGWILSYNSSDDEGDDMYIARPDKGDSISTTLSNLQEEQTYTISVTAKSKGVLSTTPLKKVIETPRHLADDLEDGVWYIGKVGVGMLSGVVVVAVLIVALVIIVVKVIKTSRGRTIYRTANDFYVRNINTNINAADINMTNTLEQLIRGECTRDTSSALSESSTVMLSDSSDE